MSKFYDPHSTSYKRPLLFKLSLRLHQLSLVSQKRSVLQLELTNNKTVVPSKNLHTLNPASPTTKLDEVFHIPVVLSFDPRKTRFAPYNISISILSCHSRFSKKLGSTTFSVSRILNTGVLRSQETLKLEKCPDKKAVLRLTAELELRDIEELEEDRGVNDSFLINSIHRLVKQ